MRAAFVTVLLALAVTSSAQSKPPAVGDPVPDFKLYSPTLKTAVQLAALKGKPVVLNFWGSWCKPCRDEMPAMNEVAGQLKDKFVLLAVGMHEPVARSLDYLQKNNFANFTLLGDPEVGAVGDLETSSQVAGKYGVNSFPTTLFIDKDGVVQATRGSGLTKRTFLSYLRNIDVTP